jgi:NTP pyrophosphatase (non-canonical NTP hydrolase)
MNFKEYQDWAKTTAIYPEQIKGLYPLLGLIGETAETVEKISSKTPLVGDKSDIVIPNEAAENLRIKSEIFTNIQLYGKKAEILKKQWRKYGLGCNFQTLITTNAEDKEEIKKELGDILWYLAAICTDLGLNLQDVAQTNHDKLESRKERNVLHGSGDNR